MTNKHKYTDEEREFLRKEIKAVHSYQELTNIFNDKYKLNMKMITIRDYCSKRLHIKLGKNVGQFKTGAAIAPVTHQIGDEVWRCGYIFIKYNDKYINGVSQYRDLKENWKPKHRYIYEEQFGNIPEGNIVVFLDKNRTNFNINNLYCIDRKINAVMCSNNWFSKNPQFTLTAIKYCELYYGLKERKVNNENS